MEIEQKIFNPLAYSMEVDIPLSGILNETTPVEGSNNCPCSGGSLQNEQENIHEGLARRGLI
jgi:hypothetical protein